MKVLREHTRIKRLVAKMMAFLLMVGMLLGSARLEVRAEGEVPIMGASQVTIGQMINYYQSKAVYPYFYSGTDAPTIYDFCKIYMEEAAAEGVRADVAFAQAMKETGFLKFGGDVVIEQFNFAGIGTTGGGVQGAYFPSVRIGVRAQIQHLKAYGSSAKLNLEQVDPRYHLVNPKGKCPYVQNLGTAGWATAAGYGVSIVNDYLTPLIYCSPYSAWYNGMDYSAVYDPNYYMMKYADIAGYDSDQLLGHYVNNGMAEGRQGNPEFNVFTYMDNYPDLRAAFGDDLKLYYIHYIQTGKAEGRNASTSLTQSQGLTVYRLYCPSNGEHLYTTDLNERNVLMSSSGWTYEGVGWTSPTEGTPVYRLYNPVLKNHLYTTDTNEINVLTTQNGWVLDNNGNPLLYSGGDKPIYRLYNEGLSGMHHLTTDTNEYNVLPGYGWQQEGVALYGLQ